LSNFLTVQFNWSISPSKATNLIPHLPATFKKASMMMVSDW
jgi:hypothetical protein